MTGRLEGGHLRYPGELLEPAQLEGFSMPVSEALAHESEPKQDAEED